MTSTTVAPPRNGCAASLAVGLEVILYPRVSTIEQMDEGVSLAAQETELRRYAEQRWPDAPIRVEHEQRGKSSAKAGAHRPTFESIVERIQAGRVRALLVQRLDRIARGTGEWLVLREACAESGTELHTLANGNIEVGQPMGKLLTSVLIAIAEYENDLKSERVKGAVNYLQTHGLWHGGQLPLTLTVSPERVLCETDETAYVREAFRLLVEERWSVKRLARFLSDKLGQKISPTTAGRILRNPHYAGWIVQGDKQIEGEHEQFVPRDLWHRAQAILDKKQASGTRHPRKNPFGDLARCYCGGRLEWRPLHGRAYVSLRCERRRTGECDSPYLPLENFEAAVVSTLTHAYADLIASLDHPKWTWYATSADTEPERRERLAEVTTELADIEQRSGRLYDAFEEGTIDRDKYLARAKELNEQRAGLEALRADLARDERAVRDELASLRDALAGNVADDTRSELRPVAAWLNASTDERYELLRRTIQRIELEGGDGYAVTVTFRPGPALTCHLSAKRNADSAAYRALGFGVAVKQPRAPPTSPPPFASPDVPAASRPLGRMNRPSAAWLPSADPAQVMPSRRRS